MKLAGLAIPLVAAIAAPGCGYTTAPTTAAVFALDAGNYTLKISGTGTCSSGTIEGSGPVTVTRAGSVWAARSAQSGDSFAMSFTIDGATAGSVQGVISGTLSGAGGSTTSPVGSVTGNSAGANVVGGPISSAGSGLTFVVTFGPSGGGCTSATWTLTPR